MPYLQCWLQASNGEGYTRGGRQSVTPSLCQQAPCTRRPACLRRAPATYLQMRLLRARGQSRGAFEHPPVAAQRGRLAVGKFCLVKDSFLNNEQLTVITVIV